jgi:hypothetical protein
MRRNNSGLAAATTSFVRRCAVSVLFVCVLVLCTVELYGCFAPLLVFCGFCFSILFMFTADADGFVNHEGHME